MANIKIPSNLFKLERVVLLEGLRYGEVMVTTWLKLLTKSKRVENRKFIWKVTDNFEITNDALSCVFRLGEYECDYIFSTLEEYGFIKRSLTHIEVFKIWEGNQRNRSTPEYRNWRKSVFERDDYTCQVCTVKGSRLNAHHIIAWIDSKEKRFDINNGVTLCEKCHKKLHRKEFINGRC